MDWFPGRGETGFFKRVCDVNLKGQYAMLNQYTFCRNLRIFHLTKLCAVCKHHSLRDVLANDAMTLGVFAEWLVRLPRTPKAAGSRPGQWQ